MGVWLVNKKEMEERILELEEMVRELTSIVRLIVDGFKQTDNLATIKDLITIAKGTHKGMAKNTDFIIKITKYLRKVELESKKKKQNNRGIYI